MAELLHAHICFRSLSLGVEAAEVRGVRCSHGAEDEAATAEARTARVLVAGRPSAELLDSLPILEYLVVPYVGIPARTMRLLAARPHLHLLHLHHNAQAVAEGALALAFAAARRVVPMHESLKRLDWRARYEPDPALRLGGRRALLLGFGAIGSRIAPVLSALRMDVQVVRRVPSASTEWPQHTASELPVLLPGCDLLIASLPSTPQTRGLLGRDEIALLRRHAVVVNVGRADLFDEHALFEALSEQRIGAAGLDVWWKYPDSESARARTAPSVWPFHELDNVVLSPHRSGHDDQVEPDRFEHLKGLLLALASSEPVDHWRVDRAAGY